MPIPFQPLIGSSFDALAGQNQYWAGFNRSVDEGNINRATQAQQSQNDWLRQAAALRDQANQRDLSLQLNADAVAREAAAQGRAETEGARRFDIGTALDKERLKAENTRTAEMGKVAETNLALTQHAREQQIESAGQTAANSYLIAKNNADAAGKAYERIQSQVDDIEKEQQDLLAQTPKKKEDIAQRGAKLSSLGLKSKALSGALRQATTEKQRAENTYQSLAQRIQNQGFTLDLENDQVVHPATGKKWSFKGSLDKAKAAVESGDIADTSGLGAYLAGGADNTPPMWAGFGAGTATGTAQPLAAPVAPAGPPSSGNVLRIGRFQVTPQ